jgi:predicted ABC-type transport system involved in lysophospholipase L1 biosynthesis ATPase subunit
MCESKVRVSHDSALSERSNRTIEVIDGRVNGP